MSEQKHIWRLLENGEITADGDEFFHADERQWFGANYGLPINPGNSPTRRRVLASPIIRDARTDPPSVCNGVVIAFDKTGRQWQFADWDSDLFEMGRLSHWFALPSIPEPEKNKAELAFDEAQKAFASQKYKDAVDWASFSKGYEMGKTAK